MDLCFRRTYFLNLLKYVNRAMSATGHNITYKLGKGGFFPKDALPTRTGTCDCSGFVSWVLGLSRIPKSTRLWWIETTNIYNDATGRQRVFKELPAPVPGCVVVFPDRKIGNRKREGHVGIVESVRSYNNYSVIDCTRRGITVQGGDYFRANRAIFCILKDDDR